MPKIEKKQAAPAATAAVGTPGTPTGPRLGSVRHDLMVSGGGLAKNFWGTIEDIYYAPRFQEKGKKPNSYVCAAYVHIRAEDPELGDKGLVREIMKVADLDQWAPCTVDAAGNIILAGGLLSVDDLIKLANAQASLPDPNDVERFRGDHILGIGTKDLSSSSKWNQWTREITNAKFPVERQGLSIECFKGVRAFWVRIPFVDAKGQKPSFEREPSADGQPVRDIETLVAAEIDMSSLEAPKVAGGKLAAATAKAAAQTVAATPAATPVEAAPAPAAAAPTPAAPATTATLDERLEAAVLEALATAAPIEVEGLGALPGLHKTQFTDVLKATFEGKELSQATLKMMDDRWLGDDARTFGFLAATQQLVLLPAAE